MPTANDVSSFVDLGLKHDKERHMVEEMKNNTNLGSGYMYTGLIVVMI